MKERIEARYLESSPLFPEKQLREKAADVLLEAKKIGMDAAEVLITTEVGFAATARLGDVETLEHHQEKGLLITVYCNQRQGVASTSDLHPEAISQTLKKASTITRFAGDVTHR